MSICRWRSRVTGELEVVSFWQFEWLRERWLEGAKVFAEDAPWTR
jgi:hypothetical protein